VDTATSELNPADPRSVAEHLLVTTEEPQEATLEETSEDVEEVEAEAETVIEDEEYAEEEATLPEEPQSFTVKVDGEDKEVNLEELKRGYSGQTYIQHKMREIAEQRKHAEATVAQAQQAEQRYAQAMKAYADGLNKSEPKPPDASMRESDPFGYLQGMEDYRQEVDARQKLQQEQHVQAQREAQSMAQQQQNHVKQQTQVVLERIPELRDKETAPKALEMMMGEGRKRGFSDAELQGASDPRFVEALHDLAKLRTQGNLASGREVKRGAIKPGSRKTPISRSFKQAEAARTQMRKTGKTEDIAAFLLTKG
jgi:hypothetical protein